MDIWIFGMLSCRREMEKSNTAVKKQEEEESSPLKEIVFLINVQHPILRETFLTFVLMY